MRLIVTGSRYLDHTGRLLLIRALTQHHHAGRLVIAVGDCPSGADAYTRDWGRLHEQRGVTVEVYHADWSRGRRGGPERNARMVADGADRVLAFWQPGADSPGTTDCVARARKAGLEVREFTAAVTA
jgi:hypothetical protein